MTPAPHEQVSETSKKEKQPTSSKRSRHYGNVVFMVPGGGLGCSSGLHFDGETRSARRWKDDRRANTEISGAIGGQ